MSEFKAKTIRGEVHSDEDWNRFLIEAHTVAPSMTPDAFVPHKTNEGLTSYEVLLEVLSTDSPKPSVIVDLACGDGHLIQFLLSRTSDSGTVIGIDMSETELRVARERYGKDRRVRLHQAKAQSIPLPSRSVDVVLCHMAFMLMMPLKPVISELQRILLPGGKFHAVIGNPAAESGLYKEIRDTMFRFFDELYPHLRHAKSGDPRVRNETGLKELFSETKGFSDDLEIFDFSVSLKTDPQGVWDFLKNMYFVSFLSSSEKNSLENQLKEFLQPHLDERGLVHLQHPMRRFSVTKASDGP